jgi:hypothetical protein
MWKRHFQSGICVLLVLLLVFGSPPLGNTVSAASADIAVPNGSFENQLTNWTTNDNGSGAISVNADGWTPSGGGVNKLNYQRRF